MEDGARRRLVMRLKGFSSTFSRRDLWRASVTVSVDLSGQGLKDLDTFFGLVE